MVSIPPLDEARVLFFCRLMCVFSRKQNSGGHAPVLCRRGAT